MIGAANIYKNKNLVLDKNIFVNESNDAASNNKSSNVDVLLRAPFLLVILDNRDVVFEGFN